MIKVLFLAANPTNTKPLAIGSEYRNITTEVRQSIHGQAFEIVVELAVRVADLQAALLRHKPTIVHFAGHGRGTDAVPDGREFDTPLGNATTDGILFEDDAGNAVPVPVGALANLFRIVRTVECVVLCACHSAAQAEAIRRHVKFVVGMDRAILDESAIAFSAAFYRALAFGETIETAFELGRNAIEFKGHADSGVPVLLPHDSVDAATWSLESRASNSTPFAMFSIPPRLLDIPERQSRPFDRRSDDEPERSFLKQVKRITKLRSPKAEIIPQWSPHPFLGVLNVESVEGSSLRVEFVVVIDQPMTMELLHEYRTTIEPHIRSQWHYAPVTLVHTGVAAPEEMRRSAERRAVFLKSFSEYQGLLDFTEYLGKQTRRLLDDPVYPQWLYVDQRAKWSYAGSLDEFHTERLFDTLWKELDAPAQPRFLVVLGEFGVGKTFLLHELARRMVVEEHPLVPVLVQLSKLEKASSIKQLLAQHFAAADMGQYHYDGFQYMLEQGRIALLFDGFDELALRLSYDRVMAHFHTIMTAVQGLAKVVLTSRRQHFLTDGEVKRELRIEAERVIGSRFFLIERFEKQQILQFLRNTLRSEEEADARFRLLDKVKDLLGLSENPRMLGFIAKIDKRKLLAAEAQNRDVTSA
ncbi:MAG TPA: NACHT domain-containing protein, partial [Polyangium sp.]|nr:NACHT domain-containing protein [Polyangium sp.]